MSEKQPINPYINLRKYETEEALKKQNISNQETDHEEFLTEEDFKRMYTQNKKNK
jgi:hypothetical protein